MPLSMVLCNVLSSIPVLPGSLHSCPLHWLSGLALPPPCRSYKAYLQSAAAELQAVRNGPGGVLFCNLSPAWRNVEACE